MSESPQDMELVLRLRKGDRDAYRQLFERHYGYLCDQAALRLGGDSVRAEEVVQQVFIDFWVQELYRQVETSVGAFLSRMVRFRVIDMKRRVSRRQEVEKDFSDDYFSYTGMEQGSTPAEAADVKKALHEAIGQLPEERRKIFTAVYLEDKSYREVAEAYGISVNTVKTQMRRSLEKLRELLRDYLVTVLLFSLSVSPSLQLLNDLRAAYGTS